MPIQPFGQADPVYDALRVMSNHGIEAGASDDAIPPGSGGLLNKIYVWHADGSTIDLFDPDETGLNNALAAAASGDTVWLPSIPIACTAAVTIPAGAALRGISHDAILSFSGFAGAAIVLSAGSIIDSFTLDHSDGKWFDASADGAKALRIHGTAKRATTGISTTPQLIEIWMCNIKATDPALYWRNVSGTWNKIAAASLPITPNSDSATIFSDAFLITPTGVGFIANGDEVWASNTPKSGGWARIYQKNSTPVAGHTGSSIFYGARITGETLSGFCGINVSNGWAYGEYTNGTWTWTRLADANIGNFEGYGYRTNSWDNGGVKVYAQPGDTFIESAQVDGEILYAPSTRRYGMRRSGGACYLREIGVGDIVQTIASGFVDNDVSVIHFRSSVTGASIMHTQKDGKLWLSDDGSAFSNAITWNQGVVCDVNYSGGGNLIWILANATNGATTIRNYARSGASNTDLTSNLWSLTAVDLVMSGMGLVYSL